MTNLIAFIYTLSFSILFGMDTPKEIDSPSQIVTEIQFDAEVFQQNLQIKKGMIETYKQARKAKRIPKPAGSPIYISNQKSGKAFKKETPAKKVLENGVHLEKRENAKQRLNELRAQSKAGNTTVIHDEMRNIKFNHQTSTRSRSRSIGTEFEFETIANLYEAFGYVLATEGSGCDGCPGNLNEMEDVASFPIFRQDSFEAWASDSGFTAFYFQFIDENETGEYDDGEIYAVSCEGSANSNNMTVAYNGSVYNLDFVDFWMEAYDFEWESDDEEDNYSLSFDGLDDYANIVELSTAIDNSNITLMGWFKSTSNGEPNIYHEGIFGFRNYPSSNGNYYASMNWTGWSNVPTIECYGGAPANIPLTPNDDTWYHLALVYDNTNAVFSTYLDGIQMASNTATNDPIVPSIDLLIGNNIENGNHFFQGYIDDISLWSVALSQENIQSYLSSELNGNETGLVSYWNFNEGSGTTLTDQTSNGNNGTIYGATWSDDVPYDDDNEDEWTFLGEFDGHEYYVSNFESTWNDANNMFNDYYEEEVHLVTISSQEENDFVQENVGDLSVWIGFTDEAEEGNWQWVTGEEVVYTNWNEGEPNGGDVENGCELLGGGTWNDQNVDSFRPFVVEVFGDTTGGDFGVIYGSVQDMDGWGIPYADVQAWNYDYFYAVTTDGNGNFSMEVPAGYYDMEAWAPGFSSGMNWVEVYPNESSWVEFWLYQEDDYNTLVHGHVHDVDGNPLSFANVNANYLYDDWESEGTFTNEDGYYELYLYDDAYRISAGAEGFWVSAYDSIYIGGDSLWLDFELSSVGEFDGGWQGNINLVGNYDPEMIFLGIMSEDYQVFRILYEPGPQEIDLVNGSYHLIAGADGYQEVFMPNAINIENNVVNFDIHLVQEGLLLPPQIEFAGDVPNDQGRQMRLVWNPGVPGDWGYFEFFSIWRQVNEAPMILWDFIDVVPWHGMEAYSAVVPTLGDSTDMGIYWSTFRVTGHTENPNEFYDSAPVSGYSIDNIHPGAPGGVQAFTGGEGILLTWDSSMDEDFGYHRIYRYDTNSGDPAIQFTTVDTFYVDDAAEGNYEYWITAVDLNGNESDPSIIVTVTLAIDNGLTVPIEFALQQNYPNPFNPSTQIQYALPTDANVTIAIYDLVGRQIRTLVNEQVNAGYHSTLWNATNDMGSSVSAGVYIYTITANDFRDVKKMILLK